MQSDNIILNKNMPHLKPQGRLCIKSRGYADVSQVQFAHPLLNAGRSQPLLGQSQGHGSRGFDGRVKDGAGGHVRPGRRVQGQNRSILTIGPADEIACRATWRAL
jgi:hypothetical protein